MIGMCLISLTSAMDFDNKLNSIKITKDVPVTIGSELIDYVKKRFEK